MRICAEFWVGLGAGIMAGAAMGMMTPCSAKSMKRQVGRSVRKLSNAMDHAVDSLVSELR